MNDNEISLAPELQVNTPDYSDGSITVDLPIEQPKPAKNIKVYATSVSPASYSVDENSDIVKFDITFSVCCECLETNTTENYQVIKRIGVDKFKMAEDAMLSTPVSVIESKENKVKPSLSKSRLKELAGLK